MDENWFRDVFGFCEPDAYARVRQVFRMEGETLVGQSALGTKRFHVGPFGTPSVSELRARLSEGGRGGAVAASSERITFAHVAGDARDVHRDPAYAGAVMQVASQCNALEMIDPRARPEDGVTCYHRDHTQGPTCAMEAAAALVYRNYLVNGAGQGGAGRQLDLWADVGRVLGNEVAGGAKPRYWAVCNGYCLPRRSSSLAQLNKTLTPVKLAAARAALRVGVQWDTAVTSAAHRVCQVFSCAAPITYSSTSAEHWEPLARVALDGTYEAAFAVAALLAKQRGARVKLVLTAVGGGVFGNPPAWIASAIKRALAMFREHPLDVELLHFREVVPEYAAAVPAVRGV